MGKADELLARYLLTQVRDREVHFDAPNGREMDEHFATCPDVRIEHPEGQNGSYGCDTGCEYVTLEAEAVCPHHRVPFEYGEFGDLAMIIEDLEKMTGA